MSQMSPQKKGFTLIELLVVISIIAVLLSILMPALNKAKYITKRICCMNNIKSQGLAFFMYATENWGKYPPHNSYLAYYLTFPPVTNACNPWTALRDTYITDSDILICPVLAVLGDMFGSTKFIASNGEYGGWDTPTVTYNRIPYNWYANHRPPNSSGDLSFNHGERLWPKNMSSSNSSNTIITHTVFQIPTLLGFYDYSHGGSGGWSPPEDLFSSDILDNPIGHGDGSVTFRKKTHMLPRVSFTNDGYGYHEYYY